MSIKEWIIIIIFLIGFCLSFTIEYTNRQRMIANDVEIYNNGIEIIGDAISTFILIPFVKQDSTKNK